MSKNKFRTALIFSDKILGNEDLFTTWEQALIDTRAALKKYPDCISVLIWSSEKVYLRDRRHLRGGKLKKVLTAPKQLEGLKQLEMPI